jgi:excisionase family DNA binding protein
MQLQELMDTKDVARFLKLSDRTVEDWVYQSRKGTVPDPIPYHKLGRLTRFHPTELTAWLTRRKNGGVVVASTVEYGNR